MPQPPDESELRRADDRTVLAALADGRPLALAEAYHRTVPAAHAVARRMVGGPSQVEALLWEVYDQLWSSPPADGPLEGWVRRTTWARAAEQLRAAGSAPASPSAAALLPDLPAPDVRFLDAAERAIADLPDEERRALLLAHDKGVPAGDQDPGADAALLRALVALAGPEGAGADADAMAADPCDDLPGLGDACLGLLDRPADDRVAAALQDRPGCAARSRMARRGRRRIEGLPATPDMGQRILVSVLATAGAFAGGAAAAADADEADLGEAPPPPDQPLADQPLGDQPLEDQPLADQVVGDRPADDQGAGSGLPAGAVLPVGAPAADQPGGADAQDHPEAGAGADQPPGADDLHDGPAGWDDEPDPFAPLGPDDAAAGADIDTGRWDPAAEGVPVDTADLPAADPDPSPTTGSWVPGPGDSTAELRLSDILADEGDDDDPFAALADPDDAAPARTGDPYSALRGLDEGEERPAPQGPVSSAFGGPQADQRPVRLPEEDEELVGGYVEGQEADDDDYVAADRPGGMAALLSWALPILGGGLIGVIIAIAVFGTPG